MQNNLNKLERDCKVVDAKIGELLAADAVVRGRNRKAAWWGLLLMGASLLGPALLLLLFAHRAGLLHKATQLVAASSGASIPEEVHAAISWVGQTCDALVAPDAAAEAAAAAAAAAATAAAEEAAAAAAAEEGQAQLPGLPAAAASYAAAVGGGLLTLPQFMLGTLGVFLTFQVASRLVWRYEPCFTKREASNLLGTQRYVMENLLELKVRLYKLYLDQCSSEVQ